ncbi:MAG: glycyl-radical enzyme activating protein [Bacteroidota bacterium]
MRGRMLDLRRLSIHDGPGIRTTLFLKGCPLNCRWCHNPESVSTEPEIGLLKRKCRGCGKCAQVCPKGAHRFREDEHVIDRERCTACGKCVEACLPGALEYYGADLSAAQAVAAVLEDRTFYVQSGGGCTISGGEPLWQAEFCAEVFALLRQEAVHCALDTSGAVSWESFEIVLPHTDLFLYDLKHTDDRLHQAQTGRSNTQILDNLQRLSGRGVPIEVRIPTIPGFNADEVSISAIAGFLSKLRNIVAVRLLPYHAARSKYDAIGRACTMPAVEPPDQAAMDRFAAILHSQGLVTA